MIFLSEILIFAFCVFIFGSVFGVIFNLYCNKNFVYRMIFGFWGGSLLSFMCFGFLSDVFYSGGIFYAVVFVFSGLIFSTIFEKYADNKFFNVLHCFCMGLILSAIFFDRENFFISSSIVTAMYILGVLDYSNIFYGILLSIIVSLSGVLGIYLKFGYEKIAEFIFALGGGVILYVICREVLPENMRNFKDIFISFAVIFGFICGMVIFSINV